MSRRKPQPFNVPTSDPDYDKLWHKHRRATDETYRDGRYYYHAKVAYGVGKAELDALFVRQGGVCAICGTDNPSGGRRKRFAVDHCHKTGKVRGLLCNRCNVGVGSFRDDPLLAVEAAAYIIRHL